MSRKAKPKGTRKPAKPKAVRELRVQTLVLVDPKGREYGRIEYDPEGGAVFQLGDPDNGTEVELCSGRSGAGLTVSDSDSEEDVLVELLADGYTPGERRGILSLGDGGGMDPTIDKEALNALRSVADGIALETDPPELREAVATLRKFYRRSNGREWKAVALALLSGIKAADAGKAVQP